MPVSEWRGAAPPEDRGPTVYTVVGATTDRLLDLTLLDERITGVPCHWAFDEVKGRERSFLCLRFQGDCALCKSRTREVWLGFLAAYDHGHRERIVFRMGPEGARQMRGLMQAGSGLRGNRVLIGLATAGRTGSLVITRADQQPLIPLIDAHKTDATICTVLKCRDLPGYLFAPSEVSQTNEEGKEPPKRA